MNLTQKIIGSHLVSGTMTPGSEIGLRIDQTLTQDATGTMAWLQFEALGIPRVKTDISLSYVDHNTLQMNFRNPDDHRFLRTVAAKFGGVYSGPGTGICHQLHLENFAKPGATLVGSDSHTPTAGGICSLAMGAGGLSVALAMAGEPYYIPMPKVVRVFLTGALTGWASAKDVILELLRRRTVKGGVGRVFEYAGPGVATLSVPERATIANMGAELGATGTLFPSDGVTRAFLKAMGREADWRELGPDADAAYDEEEAIDHRLRRTPARMFLRPVHRFRRRTRHLRRKRPYLQPQLRGAQRHQGRQGLSGQPPDRRPSRPERQVHRSRHMGDPARQAGTARRSAVHPAPVRVPAGKR